MAEYIERETALDIFGEGPLWTGYFEHYPLEVHLAVVGVARLIREEIGKIPAADVAPVVHGRWTHLGGDEWCCPVCGFVITTEGSWDKPTKKYCEDCGAKMDEKGEEA